jgi:hypothetical protein
MTGPESRQLVITDRVSWQASTSDLGTVIEKNWAGVVIKWDSRGEQPILHNDMAQIERVPNK